MPPRSKSQNQQELDAVRLPPAAVGAEKSVLSSILQEPEKYIPLAYALKVTVDDFYLPSHQTLLSRIYKLHHEDQAIELVSLIQHLLDNGELDRIGGPAALTDIYTYAAGGQHMKSHVALLRAKRALRLTVQMGNEIINEAYDAPAELADLADTIKRRSDHVLGLIEDPFNDKAKLQAQVVTMEEVLPEIERLARVDAMGGGDPFFMPHFPVGFRLRESTLWFGLTGHGKALALDTQIPTTTGLRPIKDVHPGDWVFSPSGYRVQVIDESPVFLDHECYEVVFNDGAKVIADANHQWTVSSLESRRSATAQRKSKAKRIKVNYNQLHKTHKLLTVTTKGLAKLIADKRKPCIDACKPIMEGCPETEFLIHPYVLGAWLGDGYSDDGGFCCHPNDQQIIWEIRRYGYEVNKRSGKFSWGTKGLYNHLKAVGLLKNKHIPHHYLIADYESRLALLQGLMDTDGHINKNDRRCEFCTIKKDLAEQVIILCSSLGIKASLCQGDATIDGRFISRKYRVLFLTDLPVFRLQRKLDYVPKSVQAMVKRRKVLSVTKVKSVPVKCISVNSDDHLFLCTEHFIATHNSQTLQNLIAHLILLDRKVALASLEQPSATTYFQILVALTADPLIGVRPYFQQALRWLMDRVFIYKGMDRVSPRVVLEFFRQCYLEHGVGHVVTDNVMTLRIARGDNNAQAEAADDYRVFTSNYDLHNHLVAHPRKPAQETSTKHNGYPPPPTLYDINGAGEWGNMPNNVIVVWRDMIKAEAIAQREQTQSKSEVKTFRDSTPCGKFVTRKQRGGSGKLPSVPFLFDEPTRRFQRCPSSGPVKAIYGDNAPWD